MAMVSVDDSSYGRTSYRQVADHPPYRHRSQQTTQVGWFCLMINFVSEDKTSAAQMQL